MEYFSDIELGERERISEEVTEDIHNGIVAIYKKYASQNSFSESASVDCPDGMPGICGFDNVKFINLARGEIPNIELKYSTEYYDQNFDTQKKSYDKYNLTFAPKPKHFLSNILQHSDDTH